MKPGEGRVRTRMTRAPFGTPSVVNLAKKCPAFMARYRAHKSQSLNLTPSRTKSCPLLTFLFVFKDPLVPLIYTYVFHVVCFPFRFLDRNFVCNLHIITLILFILLHTKYDSQIIQFSFFSDPRLSRDHVSYPYLYYTPHYTGNLTTPSP